MKRNIEMRYIIQDTLNSVQCYVYICNIDVCTVIYVILMSVQ